MSTRKISDLPKQEICTSEEHNPPKYMVYEDGIYEHICPACGKITTFRVNNPKL